MGLLGLAAAGSLLAPPVLGRARPRAVIVGGGPAGMGAARAMAMQFKGIEITVVEANRRYVTPFFANRFLGGLDPLDHFIFGYDKANSGKGMQSTIHVVQGRAETVDADRRLVRLDGGDTLPYDRLVLAPGVSRVEGGIDGYGIEAETLMPHAYLDSRSEQWRNLNDRIRAMDDGGVVTISVPKRPYRCHPAPYERASLIAARLQREKPRSKVLILDANDSFPLMDAIIPFWEKRFGDILEWVPAEFGGAVVGIDPKTGTLKTVDDTIWPTVASVIPPQQAGGLAIKTGLADETGWCPVDGTTFESHLLPGVHVIGDAIDPGDMPRAAYGAYSQAQACAVAVGNALTGGSRAIPALSNRCYFLLANHHGMVVRGRYKILKGRIEGIEGGASTPGESDEQRAAMAKEADHWYSEITHNVFGA